MPTDPTDTTVPQTSADLTAELIRALRAQVPHVFSEAGLDIDKLKAALGENVVESKERYGLTWAGKAEAFRNVQSVSSGTLAPMQSESVNWDATENLIIEGDNLEVLKLLQRPYHGQVKMIYIDPPYNTGNEFIYPDNFREGLQDYLRYSGQVQDDGTLASSTVDREGRVHSSWLSMMYPRLFLAKNLLRNDGVIFVSIDYHEVHNLRLLLNEIFGEENFITCITIINNPKGRVLSEHFALSHEYSMVFSRSAEDAEFSVAKSAEQIKKEYTNNDDNGWYRPLELRNTHRKFGRFNRENLYFPLYIQPTNINSKGESPIYLDAGADDEGLISILPIWDDGFEGCWTWGIPKVRKQIASLHARYVNGRWKVYRKAYAINSEGQAVRKKLKTVWTEAQLHTEKGQSSFDRLIDGGIFQSPKPIELIKTMLRVSAADDDIILDFFAGSGTTAEAVLELNNEDGDNRKFILVQLPEKTDNKQFPTIADITRERVRRVIDKMNAADADKLPIDEDAPDRGFKAFRLTSSNFKVWDGDGAQTDASELAVQLEAFASNILPSATPDAMLYEIMLRAGLEIGASRETVMMGGQVVENIGNGALLVCLEPDIHLATLRAMIAARPRFVVCLDTALHGDDALLTNAELEAKAAGKDNVTFYTV